MDPLENLLHEAVKIGNIQDVKALILNGVEINAQNRVCYAVFQNMATIVTILLQNGADPNVKDSILSTPLHIAALYGFLEMVKMLVAKNAEINANDIFGYTPLHQAAMEGHDLVLGILLQNDANISSNYF